MTHLQMVQIVFLIQLHLLVVVVEEILVKQVVKVREGIASEDAKKIQRLIKDSKLKVQAAIQGESVRVTGAKRDDLQAAMALIRKDMTDLPLTFDNFRD